jgi:hypothetical protein
MANPATVADIEARWRPLTAQETTNADALLADAWALLIARRPTLEADITAGTVSTENVVRVVVAMVLRVLRNPDGKLEESIDDYTYRRDSAVSTGSLYVTPDELADLTPGRRRQRSVRLVAYGDV